MKLVTAILALVLTSSALVTNEIHIQNHGGWSLLANVGADPGDLITIDVACDHDVNGYCFVSPPSLKDGENFELIENNPRHQFYRLQVSNLGDQIITASYWWVGFDVHYTIEIVAQN